MSRKMQKDMMVIVQRCFYKEFKNITTEQFSRFCQDIFSYSCATH